MGKVMIAILLAFTVTIAAVIGYRMSADAMAVVVGVVCGVAASIPMSLLILFVANRSRRQGEITQPLYGRQSGQYGAYPPVVVIQGGTPTPNQWQRPYYGSPVDAAPRGFHIVGEE